MRELNNELKIKERVCEKLFSNSPIIALICVFLKKNSKN